MSVSSFTWRASLRPRRASLDHDEVISVRPVALDEALAMIARGEMVDAKSIVALLRARDFLAGAG